MSTGAPTTTALVTLADLEAMANRWCDRTDPALLLGADAARDAEQLARLVRRLQVKQVALAARAKEVNSFSGRFPTAAAWQAHINGCSQSEAKRGLDTAERLVQCPEVAAALEAGEISVDEAHLVTSAAVVNPGSERRLVDQARKHNFADTRTAVDRARHAVFSCEQEQARLARMRKLRRTRESTDGDQLAWVDSHFVPEAWATVKPVLDAFTDAEFRQARREGRREDPAAYRADGLLAALRAAGNAIGLPKPPAPPPPTGSGGGSPAPSTNSGGSPAPPAGPAGPSRPIGPTPAPTADRAAAPTPTSHDRPDRDPTSGSSTTGSATPEPAIAARPRLLRSGRSIQGRSAGRGDPTDLLSVVDPADPVGSMGPTVPLSVVVPADPVGSMGPTVPLSVVVPADPVGSVGPTVPLSVVVPADPVGSMGPTAPTSTPRRVSSPVVLVDAIALRRGWATDTETCELAPSGTRVSVAWIEDLLPAAAVDLLVHDRHDIRAHARVRRRRPRPRTDDAGSPADLPPTVVVLIDAVPLAHPPSDIDGDGATITVPGTDLHIALAWLRRLVPDDIAHVVEHDLIDMRHYTSATRHIPRPVRLALLARDRRCTVPGCRNRQHLERDHVHDYADGGPADSINMHGTCADHHHDKTYRDAHVVITDTERLWYPPSGTPDHPTHGPTPWRAPLGEHLTHWDLHHLPDQSPAARPTLPFT